MQKKKWGRLLVLVRVFPVIYTCFFYCNTGNTQTNVVGYWRFDEGTGTSVIDESSNGNDGTVTGATWVTGKSVSALKFDGTDDFVEIDTPTGITSSTGSIEFWMKADCVQNSTGLFHFYENRYTDYITCFLNQYGSLCLTIEDNNETKISVSYDLDNLPGGYVGKWLYVMWVQDGNGVKLYIDGEEKTLVETINSGDWWTDHLSLSKCRIGYTNYYFDGAIDEFMIFNQPPSDLDIRNRSMGRFICGHWRFDEGTGTSVTDESANSNDGTVTGATWVSGKSYYALEFDGTNDYVEINTPTGLSSPVGSIEFWMKADCVQNSTGLFHFYESPYTDYITCFLNQYGSLCLTIEGNNETKISVSYDLDNLPGGYVGKWLYVMWVQDGNGVRLYIDGEEKTLVETINSGGWWTDHLNLSKCRIGYTNNYFDGAIDEFTVLNRGMDEECIKKQWADIGSCGNWQMNENAGSEAIDSSGFGNHAEFVNMAASPWVTGHLNFNGYYEYSLRFNNSADYLEVANDTSLQITGDLTISLWIKPTTIGVKQCNLIDKNYGGEFSLILDQDGAVRLLQGKSQTAGEYFDATVIPSDCVVNAAWQHVLVTRDMTTREIKGYLNGQLENTVAYPDNSNYSPPASTTSVVKIGSGYISDYNGDIDKIRLYNRILNEDEIEKMQLLKVYPDKTYYTTESNAIAICMLDIELSGGLGSSCFYAKDSQGNTLGSNNSPGVETDLSFSISTLASGENDVSIELRNSTDELVLTRKIEVVKLMANQGYETKVDRKNGIVLRDGNGFFPIGLYMNGIASSDTTDFAEVSDANFNAVIRWNLYVNPSDAQTYLENTDAYDLLVVDRQEAYPDVFLCDYKSGTSEYFWDTYVDERDNIIDAVGYAKVMDNLIGYYSFDEPNESQYEAGLDLYSRTNTEDGYHPTIVYGAPDNNNYSGWADIYAAGMYWHPPRIEGDMESTLDIVTQYTCQVAKTAKQDHKAFWCVLMSERYAWCHKRIISPEEQRCQTYLALIHGAKGIFYFNYPVFHDDSWNMLSDLVEELLELAPSMLTADVDQSILYYNESVAAEFNPENNKFVDVQVSLRKAPESASYDYVLLAANTREYSVDVDYTISLLGVSGTVSRLFDASTYTVTNGEFSDTLAAYDTRAYTFSSTSTSAVTIDVNMEPGTPPAAETVYPDSGRPNCTNLMQNPSLEDNIIPNWPDYCWPWYASPRINSANQQWGLETANPYHLNKCLKIVDGDGNNGFYFYLTPLHTDSNGKDYTFSVYMKADQADRSVRLGSTLGYTDVSLTTSWTRYSYTCNVPANWSANNYFYVQLRDSGTIWADAVQVEQASSASSFTTD